MARTRVSKGQVRTIDISIKEEASKNIWVGNFQLPLIFRVLLRLAVGDSFFLTRKPNTVLTKCISSFWAIRCYNLAHENVMLETIYKHLKVFFVILTCHLVSSLTEILALGECKYIGSTLSRVTLEAKICITDRKFSMKPSPATCRSFTWKEELRLKVRLRKRFHKRILLWAENAIGLNSFLDSST